MIRLLFLLALFCAPVFAADYELIGGMSHARAPSDGTWWQSPLPHSFHMYSPIIGIGVGGNINSWSRWHASYEDLGVQSTQAIACPGNEPICINGTYPYSHWYGTQHPHMVTVTWEPQYGNLLGQIGLTYFNTRFRVTTPDWYSPSTGVVPESAGNVAWHPGFIVGAGYRFKDADLVLSYRYIQEKDKGEGWGNQYANLSHDTVTLTLRWRFR